MIAHVRRSDGETQSLRDHSRKVACLMASFLSPMGLLHVAHLIALLHDLGKATQAFLNYLMYAVKHPDEKKSGPSHAPAGAIFAYERWFVGDPWQRRTAQIVSMVVYGHHAGLPDCLNSDGESAYLSVITQEKKEEIHYEEAVQNFLLEAVSLDELDDLFRKACEEIRAFFKVRNDQSMFFKLGLLSRLLLSALVDADRWDSACFERGEKTEVPPDAPPDWDDLLLKLEQYTKVTFREASAIDKARALISDVCKSGAENPRGVYTLTVPTGGGKTLSSLRFALAHGAGNSMRRAFYIIPFNTILDQNADEIRKALGGYDILEHHSGVVQDSEEEFAAYRRLTERWNSGIVLTSMVQFMNALFRVENTDARRMHALYNSVLIFDEIQALPKKCTRLFEEAIQFLIQECRCTALMLTATQPRLNLEGRELISDIPALFRELRRVAYIDESRAGRDNARAAEDLVSLIRRHGSVLAVVNTKAVAQNVFKRVRAMLGPDVLCVHLSTLMCPEHRMDVLADVKARLSKRRPVFLISTALIEAGINISFPAVVRSLAGLPSVVQAGGRCNRNCEAPLGTVYIWRLSEESLGRLPEIRKGQEISDGILRHLEAHPGEIGGPETIGRYFEKERDEYKKELSFPYQDKSWESSLYDMLSDNAQCRQAALHRKDEPIKRLAMPQSFRTAGEAFCVIDQATRGILVPYGQGEQIILDLAGVHEMKDEIHLLRKAQRFSVSVFEHTYQELAAQGALMQVGETGAFALRKEFYDKMTGVRLDPGELELLNY